MSGWDGYPQDREKSSWHEVKATWGPTAIRCHFWWDGQFQDWLVLTGLREWRRVRPGDLAALVSDQPPSYQGPIISPAQHGAEVEQARREGAEAERERIAGMAHDVGLRVFALRLRARGGSDG